MRGEHREEEVVSETVAKRTFQVAFYGAAGAGKSTTLRRLHDEVPNPSALHHVPEPVAGTRTAAVFFDYQPAVDRGLRATLRLRAYTGSDIVASQAFMALIRCDALVVVYDAQRARRDDNKAAWHAAREHFTMYGVSTETLPLVIQLTQLDRAKPVSAAEARRVLGVGGDVPCVETNPAKGKGLDELASVIDRQVREAFHEGRAAGSATTTPSAKYLERAAAVAAAAEIAIACGPRAMARHHASTKAMALAPELGFATLSSLASLETALFTYWNEASGPKVDAFWAEVARHKLPFRRRDVVADVLEAGRITSRGDYETVTDLIGEARLSARDRNRLSAMLGAYETAAVRRR